YCLKRSLVPKTSSEEQFSSVFLPHHRVHCAVAGANAFLSQLRRQKCGAILDKEGGQLIIIGQASHRTWGAMVYHTPKYMYLRRLSARAAPTRGVIYIPLSIPHGLLRPRADRSLSLYPGTWIFRFFPRSRDNAVQGLSILDPFDQDRKSTRLNSSHV